MPSFIYSFIDLSPLSFLGGSLANALSILFIVTKKTALSFIDFFFYCLLILYFIYFCSGLCYFLPSSNFGLSLFFFF